MSKYTKVRNQVAPVAWPVFLLMALAAPRLRSRGPPWPALPHAGLEWELDSGQGRVSPRW